MWLSTLSKMHPCESAGHREIKRWYIQLRFVDADLKAAAHTRNRLAVDNRQTKFCCKRRVNATFPCTSIHECWVERIC